MDNSFFFLHSNYGDIMFNRYEIRRLNNENILILFLDMNYEFGDISNHQKLSNGINDHIKNMHIRFNGEKVIIVAGIVIVGTMLISRNVELITLRDYYDLAYRMNHDSKLYKFLFNIE